MKLNEYVTSLQERLKKFQALWEKMNSENPDHWPAEMNEGDWDEQFIFCYDDEDGEE